MMCRMAVKLLVAAKVLLGGLLLVGALYPHGPFEGKGMAYRLPAFLLPGLIVSARWWWRRRAGSTAPYPVALDAALTLPFLSDTLGNAFGLFDSVQHFDSVMHVLNWLILMAGLTLHMATMPFARGASRLMVIWMGGGLGAVLIVLWEIMEYGVMESGVGGLNLTYADTLGDLFLSMAGGFVGAIWAARRALPTVDTAAP